MAFLLEWFLWVQRADITELWVALVVNVIRISPWVGSFSVVLFPLLYPSPRFKLIFY